MNHSFFSKKQTIEITSFATPTCPCVQRGVTGLFGRFSLGISEARAHPEIQGGDLISGIGGFCK